MPPPSVTAAAFVRHDAHDPRPSATVAAQSRGLTIIDRLVNILQLEPACSHAPHGYATWPLSPATQSRRLAERPPVRLRLQSYIHGAPRDDSGPIIELVSPVDLEVFAEMRDASPQLVESAVSAARAAYVAHRLDTVAQRATWLADAAAVVEANASSLAELIIRDIGKPRRLADVEVRRAAQFLRACAVEITTLRGEVLPLDAVAAGAGHLGYTRRIPYGVVAAITPFNAPINLLVQKVAPALVAGNAVVVKPHPAGTRVALAVAELFSRAGLPSGLFNVITGDRAPALALAAHAGVDAVTFTGGCAGG
ncbi:MAG: aldehyde dehydrogenase family protein, partial [Casimicrobiaceae bacterium]